jgi:glycine betaine transporter
VGVFIARISRGRTVREFILGVMLAPTAFSLAWFTIFGGTAFHEELYGAGGITAIVRHDVTVALFAVFDRLPLAPVLSAVTMLLLFIFLVTSVDSATFVLGMLTSRGSLNPPTRRKVAWGISLGLMGGALLFSRNIHAIRAVAVVGAIPFTFVLLLQVAALLRGLRSEKITKFGGKP